GRAWPWLWPGAPGSCCSTSPTPASTPPVATCSTACSGGPPTTGGRCCWCPTSSTGPGPWPTAKSRSWPARYDPEMQPYRTELTPISFLRRSASVFPDRTAVVHGERRYSYRQLEDRVDRL